MQAAQSKVGKDYSPFLGFQIFIPPVFALIGKQYVQLGFGTGESHIEAIHLFQHLAAFVLGIKLFVTGVLQQRAMMHAVCHICKGRKVFIGKICKQAYLSIVCAPTAGEVVKYKHPVKLQAFGFVDGE